MFFWNVDGAVGQLGHNQPEDVALIQFYYHMLPQLLLLEGSAQTARFIEIIKNVTGDMSGFCSGQLDDPLVNLIINHQRHAKFPIVDGRVSPATAAGTFTIRGTRVVTPFIVLQMLTVWRHVMPETWPRLDLHPECPPLVRAAVRRSFA